MGASPSTTRGNIRESPSHTLKLAEKARKIATPPSRGRGDSWIWRPCCGRESHPRRVAMSRTWRVATNDTANENANSPKKRSVKIGLPFRLKQTAFQAKLAEWILRLFFQTRFSYQAKEIRNIWFQEIYITRLAVGKCLWQQDDWHATMDSRCQNIWRRGQNRAGFRRVPTRVPLATYEREQFGSDAIRGSRLLCILLLFSA